MPELRRSARRAAAAVDEPPAKKTKVETKEKEAKPKAAGSKTTEKQSALEGGTEQKKKELEEGDEIPDLTLLDENEEEVSLKDVAKKSKYLVIFAYPRASTPGCTRQACGFQSNYADFKDLDTQVFGLSADTPKAQLNFVKKQGLKYPLLSDPKRELIGILGAKKSPSGVKRSHWIFVDGKLKIKKVQISPEVSITSALKDVKELQNGK